MKRSYICGFVLGFAVLASGVSMCMQPSKGQMVKLQPSKNDGNRNKGLPCDVVIGEIPTRADIPTQRNLSAMCTAARSYIKVEELEIGRSYLVNPRTFCTVWSHTTERPNHRSSDFNNLHKLFKLTDIEADSVDQGKAFRSAIVNAIVPWNGSRDDSNHGVRTGLYLLAPLYEEGHKRFAAQLKEQHFYNKPRERDEYCVIS